MNDQEWIKLYDLHSHTTASDGMLPPEDLVTRAADKGVSVLAITDHDTVAGLEPARQAIVRKALSLELINGVEISTLWENHEIHIVGLGFDEHHPCLISLLTAQHRRREQRALQIAERLEKARIPGALDGAKRYAGEGAITRAHFARFLIEQGVATTMAGVFRHYLAKGKIGYVPPQWCTIGEAVDVLQCAGGQAVLAHPSRYGLSAKWLKRLVAYFAACGGDAMEVAQCQQAPNERTMLGSLAREAGLKASQGSDFHLPCAWIELGRKLWLPAGVVPVWQDWAQALSCQKEKSEHESVILYPS